MKNEAFKMSWCVLVMALSLSLSMSARAATDPEPRHDPDAITAKPIAEFDKEKAEPDDSHPVVKNAADADVVELPPAVKPKPATVVKAPPVKKEEPQVAPKIDIDLDTDVLKKAVKAAPVKTTTTPSTARSTPEKITTPKPLENKTIEPVADVQLVLPNKTPVPTEPGYATVLTGTLLNNTELNAGELPHLIRGVLIVPAKTTLKINAGAIVHLRSDGTSAKPLQAGTPDPSKSAAVWVYGTLVIVGENGRPVEFVGQDKDNANVLLYGAEQSKMEGARFRGTDVAQNGGVCQWINCEFNDSKYYALASGAGQFTHCTFKKCGGIFAAYDEGPWALLVRRCLFENCRDGLLLNRDPGAACLLVERNNFVGTRGANLRAMPRTTPTTTKLGEELLIGENWYGTTVEEEIDRRIVDRRTDPTIKAHLNTRLPAEKAYANTGAGAPQSSIANTLNDQQTASTKMLAALIVKQKALSEKLKVVADGRGMMPVKAMK